MMVVYGIFTSENIDVQAVCSAVFMAADFLEHEWWVDTISDEDRFISNIPLKAPDDWEPLPLWMNAISKKLVLSKVEVVQDFGSELEKMDICVIVTSPSFVEDARKMYEKCKKESKPTMVYFVDDFYSDYIGALWMEDGEVLFYNGEIPSWFGKL